MPYHKLRSAIGFACMWLQLWSLHKALYYCNRHEKRCFYGDLAFTGVLSNFTPIFNKIAMTPNNLLKKAADGLRNLAESRDFRFSLLGVAVILVISLAYFYPDVFEGNVLKQHDTVQGIANGQEAKQFYEETGETTRWTNSLFSGMPTFQISPSYESSKLITAVERAYSLWLPNPANLVFTIMLGFFIMLLAFRVKWYLALLGAVAYGFSSYFFIIIGAGHIWKFSTLAYVPPTIAGIVMCYRGRYLAGGALAAFFAMLQLAANHPQMTYYFLFVIAALVIAYFVQHYKEKTVKTWLKATGVLAVAAIIAVAANLPSLYNTYEYSKQTMRGGHSELAAESPNSTKGGLDKDYITQWSYGKSETFSLLIPNIKGGATIIPTHGENLPTSVADVESVKEKVKKGEIDYETAQNLSIFPQYFGDQPLTNGPVYVGALIFALFLLGIMVVRGPVKWALTVVTVLSIFLAWGHNMMWFTEWFIDYFPMYNKFRTVSSILVIAEFTMPLLAVLAIQQIVTTPDFFKKYSLHFYLAFGISIFFCLAAMISPAMFGSAVTAQEMELKNAYAGQGYDLTPLFLELEQARLSLVSSDALRSFIILLIGVALFWLYFKGKLNKKIFCTALGIVVLVDMFAIDKRYLNTNSFSPKPLYTANTIDPRPVDLQIMQDTSQNYRVLDMACFSDAMPSYFHKCIGGYHAAKLRRYDDLLKYQLDIANRNVNMEVVNMLNGKYIIFDDTTAQINPGALGNGWFVDKISYVDGAPAEMDALNSLNTATEAVADASFKPVLGNSSTKTPGDTIIETVYKPNELHYTAITAKGGIAVFSEIYFPWGWKATIDGKEAEIGRVNYVLRALRIPAGKHDIAFKFDPQSIHTTDTIAKIAIIITYMALIAAFAFAICRNRRDEKV